MSRFLTFGLFLSGLAAGIAATDCPEKWETYTVGEKTSCFLFASDPDKFRTFNETREYCMKLGGDLATITTKEENDWLASKKPKTEYPENYAIGYLNKNGKHYWFDEEHEIKAGDFLGIVPNEPCPPTGLCNRAKFVGRTWTKASDPFSRPTLPLCEKDPSASAVGLKPMSLTLLGLLALFAKSTF